MCILEITDSIYIVIFTTLLLVGVLFIFFKQSKKPTNSRDLSLDGFQNCENPDCVRCNLYAKVLMNAALKLKRFHKLHPHINVKRIENSLKSFIETDNDEDYINTKKSHQSPQVFKLCEMKSYPWFDDVYLKEDIALLENNFSSILDEFNNLYDNEVAKWLVNNTPDGRWHVCHLINQGSIVRNNAVLCPFTFNLVSTLPSIMKNNVFGNVAFSVIEPGTLITEHCGPTNIRARCHLGLFTPENCELHVDGESRKWHCGKCLTFDDSFLHSVQYRRSSTSSEIRVVLMVDLWHPQVTLIEKDAIDFIFAPKTSG